MLNAVHLGKLLALMEAYVPVNAPRIEGDHIWPIMRTGLGWLLRDDKLDGASDPFAAAIDEAFTDIETTMPPLQPLSSDAYVPEEHPAAPGHALFGVKAEEHAFVTDRGHYHAFLDPWVDLAAAHYKVDKLEFIQNQTSLERQPRHNPVAMISINGGDPGMTPANFADTKALAHAITVFARDRLGHDLTPRVDKLVEQVAHTRRLARLWSGYLDQRKPDATFVTCWYALENMALTWASRWRGMPSVDLQHGLISGYHFGYTHFTKVPSSGYAVLPSHFFVWGMGAVNEMARWLPAHGTEAPHQVLVGGRPDLAPTLVERRLDPLTRAMAERLRMRAAAAEKVILYTAQTIDGTRLPDIVMQAMQRAPKSWLWLVRAHPRAVYYGMTDLMPEAIGARMAAFGISNAEWEASTQLPLSTVLSLAHHHATGFSSSVQEALGLGVPSTCAHPTAHNYHRALLDAKAVGFAESPEALVAAITAGRDALPGFDTMRDHVICDASVAQHALTQTIHP